MLHGALNYYVHMVFDKFAKSSLFEWNHCVMWKSGMGFLGALVGGEKDA